MALLQIAEPGQTVAPHEHRLAAGIDLGTTNSLVATVRSGVAETLPDAEGRHILPSVVRYTADGVQVGEAAGTGCRLGARWIERIAGTRDKICKVVTNQHDDAVITGD